MTRRLAPALAAPVLLLSLVLPVLAKWDMLARLDAPIPADTPPGTTLVVGWTAFQPVEGGEVPFSGAPVFIALTAPGATTPTALVFGDEYPAGSGHFTASIVVPSGGIAPGGVSIGLRGESCEAGVCQRSDLPFELVGEVLVPVGGVAPGAVASAAVAPAGDPAAAPGEAAARTPSPTPVVVDASIDPGWLALGLVAVAGAALAVRLLRQRPSSRLATD